MTRIKLTVAYDGTNYSGWQIQPNAQTIESVLDDAIYKLTGDKIHVIGASRTDAGVHSQGNVAVFDTQSAIPPDRFTYALNAYLPKDIRVVHSCQVDEAFHPRHCDTRKTYEYRLDNGDFQMPTKRMYSWFVRGKLDIARMQEAANQLVGEHDFKSFCCVKTQAESTVRTVYSIEVIDNSAITEGDIVIRVKGNGFLYNMVRIIAGTLVKVGLGFISVDDVKKALEAKDRGQAGPTAPPQGLTLMKIEYM